MYASTDALDKRNSMVELESQQEQRGDLKKPKRNKVQIVAWDHTKTYALAVFAGCFILWAVIFFPLLLYTETP